MAKSNPDQSNEGQKNQGLPLPRVRPDDEDESAGSDTRRRQRSDIDYTTIVSESLKKTYAVTAKVLMGLAVDPEGDEGVFNFGYIGPAYKPFSKNCSKEFQRFSHCFRKKKTTLECPRSLLAADLCFAKTLDEDDLPNKLSVLERCVGEKGLEKVELRKHYVQGGCADEFFSVKYSLDEWRLLYVKERKRKTHPLANEFTQKCVKRNSTGTCMLFQIPESVRDSYFTCLLGEGFKDKTQNLLPFYSAETALPLIRDTCVEQRRLVQFFMGEQMRLSGVNAPTPSLEFFLDPQ